MRKGRSVTKEDLPSHKPFIVAEHGRAAEKLDRGGVENT